MRAICVVALTVIGALTAMAQAPQQKSAPPSAPIKCKNVNGRGCTSREVQALSDAVYAGKSRYSPFPWFSNTTPMLSPTPST